MSQPKRKHQRQWWQPRPGSPVPILWIPCGAELLCWPLSPPAPSSLPIHQCHRHQPQRCELQADQCVVLIILCKWAWDLGPCTTQEPMQELSWHFLGRQHKKRFSYSILFPFFFFFNNPAFMGKTQVQAIPSQQNTSAALCGDCRAWTNWWFNFCLKFFLTSLYRFPQESILFLASSRICVRGAKVCLGRWEYGC